MSSAFFLRVVVVRGAMEALELVVVLPSVGRLVF